MESAGRKCLECGRVLKGRLDKKFCDDYCRNAYNNKIKTGTPEIIRKINHSLSKNRKILSAVLGDQDKAKATKERLTQQGYDFTHYTHHYTTKENKVYTFCYDHGFLPLDGGWLLIVKRRDGDH